MHVAMAVPWAPWSKTGGTERHVHELASALVRQGLRVTVIVPAPVPDRPAGLPYEAVVVDTWLGRALRGLENAVRPGRATWRQLRDRLFNRQAERLALACGADLLHRHFVYAAPFRPRLPLVLTHHNAMLPLDESDGPAGRLARWDQRRRAAAIARALRDADRVICVSEHVGERIAGRLGLAAGVDIIPNGCPQAGPLPTKSEARGRLGVGPGRVVLFIGHLWHLKRVDRLLRLLEDPGLAVVLIGRGPMEERLRMTAAANPRLRLIDYVSEDEKLLWLRAADVVALPSGAFEGQGIVLLEALRVGTPVYGTHAAWLPTPLRPFGRFGDDVRLALEAIGLDASPAAALVPSWDDVARQTEAVYSRALSARTKR